MRAGGAELLYRVAAASLGWLAIVLQYWLFVEYKTDGDFVAAAVRYFSYFTALSNVLVALAMTLPWLAPATWPGRFFSRPSVRTAILAYILIVAVIHNVLLRRPDVQEFERVGDAVEHVVMPVLYTVDWLVFVPKGTLAFKSALTWLVLPLVYLMWSLIHGGLTLFYPYHFLNVARLGYEHVLRNMGLFVLGVLVLALGLIAVDRMIGTRLSRSAPGSGQP